MSTTNSRGRIARRQAASLGLRMVQRGRLFDLKDSDGRIVLSGNLDVIQEYLGEHYRGSKPGPKPGPRSHPPAAWAPLIDDYIVNMAAAGRPATTIRLRRKQLTTMARELGGKPADLTGEKLVKWFGQHRHWKPETRRSHRATVRGFLAWAYRTKRLADYLADEIPSVRQIAATPRPAPDSAWYAAIMAAEPRVMIMLRLAAEAGLRRSEVAQVHTRDLVDSVNGAQLLVHGKGGKKRVVPIGDSLAELIRQGGAGHTPGMPADSWLFPNGFGDHLTPDHVSQLVGRTLPPGWTMHTLRHRFATRAYRGTRNLPAVKTLLGHSSIATTERYLAVDDAEIRAAMEAAGA